MAKPAHLRDDQGQNSGPEVRLREDYRSWNLTEEELGIALFLGDGEGMDVWPCQLICGMTKDKTQVRKFVCEETTGPGT